MAVSSPDARKLCTRAEFELFSDGLARNIKTLDVKATKSRIPRARKLRDKYKGLADRQDREARGKQRARRRNPAKGSVQTRKKEQLFGETLQRLEKHLVKLETKPKKAAKKKPAATKSAKKKPVKKKAAPKKKKAVTKKSQPKKKVVKKTAKRKVAKAKGKPTDSTSVKKKSTKKAKSPAAAARKLRIEKHVSSRNRRNQARRDKR